MLLLSPNSACELQVPCVVLTQTLKPLDVEERQLAADDGRLLIARRDELFETERIEVEGEIPEEIALKRVVAVAEYRLSAQLGLIVLQLVFDVAKLRVELILLGFLCV